MNLHVLSSHRWLLPAGIQPWMQPHLPSHHLPASREAGQTGTERTEEGQKELLRSPAGSRLHRSCMMRLADEKQSPEEGERGHPLNSNFITVLS